MLDSIKMGMLEVSNGLKLLLDPVKNPIHSCLPALLPLQVLFNEILIGVCLALLGEFFMFAEAFLSHQVSQVADDDLFALNERLVDQLLLLAYHAIVNPLGNLPLPLNLNGVIHCLDLATEGSLKRQSNFYQGVRVSLGRLALLTQVVVLAHCTFEPDPLYGINSTLIANSWVFFTLTLLFLYFLCLSFLFLKLRLSFTPLLLIKMDTLLHFFILTLLLLYFFRLRLVKLNLDSCIEGICL